MADLEKQIERCENSIRSVYDRLDACENENIKAGVDLHAGDGGYSIGTQEKYEEFVKARNNALPATSGGTGINYSMGKTRIGQLVKECTTYYNGGLGTKIAVFDKEKFAELIVKECAELAKNKAFIIMQKAEEYAADKEEMINATNAAFHLEILEQEIKEHFGVEE